MMLFLCAVLFFSFCGGFLLPVNNTGGSSQGGNSLSDEHYVYLMGLLSVDRQNVAKMEKFVLQLKNEINTMKKQGNGQNQNNNGSILNQGIIALKNESDSLKETIVKLEDGYQSMQKELNQVKTDNEALKQDNAKLKQDNIQLKQHSIQLKQEITQIKQGNTEINGVYLQSEIVTNRNNTMQLQTEVYTYGNELLNLKQEFDIFTKSACNNASIFQKNIQLLNNKTDKMKTEMNTLTSNSKARGQDFVALLQVMNTAKQEIRNLETETKQISSDLHNYKTNTTTRIDDLQRNTSIDVVLQRTNKTVALTAHYPGGTIAGSSIVKFSTITTAIGISDINGFKQSGKFTCEVAGVYLFSVMISTRSGSYEGYYMYKNSSSLGFVYIHNYSQTSSYDMNTGTGVLAVSLNIGDTLYVQGYSSIITSNYLNTMTIVKIG